MRIGIISDTHSLMRPEALAALQGADHILHAGDIGAPEVLEALRRLAPVTAIRGNNDTGEWAATLPATEQLALGGATIYLLHDRKALAFDPASAGIRVVIAGHSHRPTVEERASVLYLNPGSAGPRRFKLPITVAQLVVERGKVDAEIVELNLRK